MSILPENSDSQETLQKKILLALQQVMANQTSIEVPENITIAGDVEVSAVTAPVAVSSVASPVSVSAISSPVAVSSVSSPVAVSSVGSITEPVTSTLNPNSITLDAGGRVRISLLTTLFDGKTLNVDNTLIWDNVGTGTGTWANNKFNMSVTTGQYYIRQAKRFAPYFSGKCQFIEATCDGFKKEAGVTKRIGYFSSNVVAPYDTTKDGFWVENDGSIISLKAQRAGTETISVPFASWDNYELVKNYDFDMFTVFAFDFLWLGGAVIRLFLKTAGGFVLCHTYNYAGSAKDTFILAPDQPIRYEIRGVSGAGSMRAICSQVSTEGSVTEEGYNGSVDTGYTAISVNVIGTTYPIKAIRKKSAYRNTSVKITGLNVFATSANDYLLWTLQLNPTLSAPLTFGDGTMTCIEQANGNGTITVTSPGRILASGYLITGATIPSGQFEKDYLCYVGTTVADVSEPLVLCVTPITTNISVFGSINYKENTN